MSVVNSMEEEVHTNVSKNVLHRMVEMYIIIRMFSTVKDYVQHCRVNKKSVNKTKDKILRKTLKKKMQVYSPFC